MKRIIVLVVLSVLLNSCFVREDVGRCGKSLGNGYCIDTLTGEKYRLRDFK